ncbi:MAG: hypothetical protein ACKVOM_00235 [Ferruginibacter sp.]
MKGIIYKYFFTVFCIFCFMCSNAQYTRVTNLDTVNYIHKQLFRFINNNIDTIILDNFKELKKGRVKQIFYVSNDTSKLLFNNLFQIPKFKNLLNKKLSDSILLTKETRLNFRFTKCTLSKIKKAACYFVIFPLVRHNDKIYLRLTSYSKGHFDDMFSGQLYFVFNDRMELVYFDYNEIVIDKL